MSYCDAALALNRIGIATKDSPIALFGRGRRDAVDVVFANTVRTQRQIRDQDPRLIGVFHRENLVAAEHAIRLHLHGGALMIASTFESVFKS